MTILNGLKSLNGTDFLFSLAHTETSASMLALKDYLENMYFG